MRVELRELELRLLRSALNRYNQIDSIRLDGVSTIWVMSRGRMYTGTYTITPIDNFIDWKEVEY